MKMSAHVRRSAVLLLVLACVACGGETPVNSTGRGPIEQLPVNETVRLPGLPASTDVVFDELGMPHVYAPDIESAVYVQGYLTASVRFWEMDVFRRFAEGRLSEVFGKLTVSTDIGMRTEFTTRDGRRLEEALWATSSESLRVARRN